MMNEKDALLVMMMTMIQIAGQAFYKVDMHDMMQLIDSFIHLFFLQIKKNSV